MSRSRFQRTLAALAILVAGAAAGAATDLPQLGKSPTRDVVAAMTREEKVSLVVGAGMRRPGLSPDRQGPVVGETAKGVPGAAGTTVPISRLGIPAIVVADGPAGLRIQPKREGDTSRTYYCTAFPIETLLASSWDTDLVERVGRAMGNEVKEYGVDVLLGPALNTHRNPLGGRNFEYYSEDPLVSGRMAAAMVKGVQSQGVGTSVKHFVANDHEWNRNVVDVKVSPRALCEIYLRGFEIVVREARPWTVMSSYNRVNGTYTSESPALLNGVLRDDWGFDGLVMTDWFGGRDAVAQMKAGNDLLMPGMARQQEALLAALASGALPEAVLDRNVTRILELIRRSPSFLGSAHSDAPDLEAHALVARDVAAQGMVLLRNEGGTLPLRTSAKLALFGNASYAMITGGTGSGDVNEAYTVSLVEGLKAAGLAVDGALAEGYAAHIAAEEKKQPAPARPFQPRPPIPERAVVPDEIARAAREADAALFTLGRNSGEGRDRKVEDDFLLSAAERARLQDVATAFHAQKKKVVVVLNIGGVIETASWRDVPDAILLAWQPGQESGHAIADVLTGRTPPSGKIATTFPMKWEDVPSSANFPGKALEGPDPNAQGPFRGDRAAEVEYTDDIFVGYRHFVTKGVKTAYPFGFGLSYTQFQYAGLKLSGTEFRGELMVRVTVTNTGSAAGREVVQLYVSAPGKALPKPALELRGFAKTKTLKPGESETLSFTLAARDLASFDEASSSWRAEAGTYTVRIGASSEDVRLTASFTKARDEKVASVTTLAADQVKTASGLVQAASDSSPTLRVFRGIPFAEPPVGDLRWKAPQPVKSWPGVRPADKFGPRCMQRAVFGDMEFRSNGTGEDCLYLNVWTPARSGDERLPVLVYFYGGGYRAGDGSEPRYDGANMAGKGIVALTVNYRLGAFGFLAHPELSREAPYHASGNYGLLDQNAALRWVQANIAAFGGDPRRVTIAGESAGSISVSAQVASPLSKDLIAGAIMESGSLIGSMTPKPLSEAEQDGVQFATGAGATSIAALRALTGEQVLELTAKPDSPRFGPVTDGYLLPKEVAAILDAGEQARVPLLGGSNSEEQSARGLLKQDEPTPENYAKAVRALYGDRTEEVLKLYSGRTQEEVLDSAMALAGDRFIGFSTWRFMEGHRKTGGQPVYRYFYSHPRPKFLGGYPAPPAGTGGAAPAAPPPPRGAAHSAEIEYAMGNLGTNTHFEWGAADHKLSELTQGYFANFIKTGNPNGPGLPTWPAYDSEGGFRIMRLDVESRAEPESTGRERYLFLDPFYVKPQPSALR